MKKIISLLLLGFMMPLGASAEVDTFMSTLSVESSLINMSAALSETSQKEENVSVAPITGKFTLKGVAGPGQGNKYRLFYVGKDKIEKESVDIPELLDVVTPDLWDLVAPENLVVLDLNKQAQLQVGFYFISYEDSHLFIEIKEGKTIEINLQRIDITPKEHKYRVYRDFSSEDERLKIARFMWVLPNHDLIPYLCGNYDHVRAAREYCKLTRSRDFNTYSKGILKFNDNSEPMTRNISCHKNACETYWKTIKERFYIKHASDSKKKETFVSALPGSYKVEFNR